MYLAVQKALDESEGCGIQVQDDLLLSVLAAEIRVDEFGGRVDS